METDRSRSPFGGTRATILLVDDERTLVLGLQKSLIQEGFQVVTAGDGRECLAKLASNHVDLVILDVMMPELDGMAVCRRLREQSRIPIIMLTARDDVVDRVLGLEYGADDYVTKPFHTRELIARIRSVLRRTTEGHTDDERLELGDLVLHRGRRTVHRAGLPLCLTAKEFDLLAVLAARPGIVFTREQLLEHVWEDELVEPRAVDVHVRRIREKLEADPTAPHLLLTKRGVGYYVSDATDEA